METVLILFTTLMFLFGVGSFWVSCEERKKLIQAQKEMQQKEEEKEKKDELKKEVHTGDDVTVFNNIADILRNNKKHK